MTAAATAFVGIDISKDTLDACVLLPGGKGRQAAFANDAGGHAALLAWADRHADGHGLHFCLEATGAYSEAPATALADAGRLVSVANPARVTAHAHPQGPAGPRPAPRPLPPRAPPPRAGGPPAPEARGLRGLARRAEAPTEMAARERGRLAPPALTKAARRSVARTVRLLEREA